MLNKLFATIRSSVEHKLYKFPKQLDVPRSSSATVAAFFQEMEKLFGSEFIINEIEEDDSDFDEEQYNNNFMKDLKMKESQILYQNQPQSGHRVS